MRDCTMIDSYWHHCASKGTSNDANFRSDSNAFQQSKWINRKQLHICFCISNEQCEKSNRIYKSSKRIWIILICLKSGCNWANQNANSNAHSLMRHLSLYTNSVCWHAFDTYYLPIQHPMNNEQQKRNQITIREERNNFTSVSIERE